MAALADGPEGRGALGAGDGVKEREESRMNEALAAAFMKQPKAFRRKLIRATQEPVFVREYTTKEGQKVRVTFTIELPA